MLISSAAQRDWAAVQARGASTRASYSICSPSKSTNCASFVLMIGRYPYRYPVLSPLRGKASRSGRRRAIQRAASFARVGAYGVMCNRRRASAGVRFALRWLHDAQAATVLDQVEPPPRLRGRTWSIVVACRPQ